MGAAAIGLKMKATLDTSLPAKRDAMHSDLGSSRDINKTTRPQDT